jgi:hypothetical protein
MSGDRPYSRARLAITLLVIGGFILADHIGSPTFRSNMGQGGVETTLSQRESQANACAPCGAPCPSDRESAAD